MTRTRLVRFVGLVVAALAVLLFLALRPVPSLVQPELYHRIALGMTEQEVDHAVGMPPGAYGPLVRSYSEETHDGDALFMTNQTGWKFHQHSPDSPGTGAYVSDSGETLAKIRSWYGRDWSIMVMFDTDGRVMRRTLLAGSEQPWLTRFVDQLKWRFNL